MTFRLSQVVSSIDNSPEILAQVQEVIIPIIVFTLEHKLLGQRSLFLLLMHRTDERLDLLDNMYDLVDSLTFKLRMISPTMWPVFELTYKLFKSDAIDFLEGAFLLNVLSSPRLIVVGTFRTEMLPSLDNFVSFGSEMIKSRSDYKQMLVDIYTTALTNDQLGENDRVNGCKLAESILLNLRGNIDDVRSPFKYPQSVLCMLTTLSSSPSKPLSVPPLRTLTKLRPHLCASPTSKFS